MGNLDFKYFIILTLLLYSTVMVLKSLKFHTSRYMKEQYKITFNIHDIHRAKRNLDYNYKEWEKGKPDIYDYLFSSTNQTLTTASDISIETSPETMLKMIPTSPTLESSQYNTSFNLSATYPTLPFTVPTPDTLLPTPYADSTPLSIIPSYSTPYNTTTATFIIPRNIVSGTTMTSTVLSTKKVGQSIRDELLEAKVNLRGGFFTASVYVLLKIIERKKSKDVMPLLKGLQEEFARLNSHHRLAMFGPKVIAVLTFVVLNIATVPVELIQRQARRGQELIKNKKTALELDTQAIFDVVDTIYTQEEFLHIAESLTDIQNFPNVFKNEINVSKEAIDAFIFIPYRKIEGTAKEKLLLMEIRNFVEKRMAIGENVTVGPNFRQNIEKNTTKIAPAVNITKFVDTTLAKRLFMIEFTYPTLYTDPKTINSSETDFTSYVTDINIMMGLKRKMRIYKRKIKRIKLQEKKDNTKRGPTTTTTTTTTTTEMPPMRKSKYYMRKYVKKDLYKMKTTTIKTTKFIWEFHGKIKKMKYNTW